MKEPTPSRAKQGAFKTMPLRWSFRPREKPLGASVELVEYLESRRRPRSTSQSIVPLLTGAAGEDVKSDAASSAKGEDGGRATERVLAGVPCPSGHPNHCAAPGIPDGPNAARKAKEHASQDIRLPKQFDLPLAVTPSVGTEKRVRPEGQKTADYEGSGQAGSRCWVSLWNTLARMRASVEARDPETDRCPQGTFTLLRSVFWKKENKHDRAEVALRASPVSLGSGRLSPAVDELARGSSPSFQIRESLARAPANRLERDVWSAPSSLRLPRKAGRPPRASALGLSQRTVPGDHTAFGHKPISGGRAWSQPQPSYMDWKCPPPPEGKRRCFLLRWESGQTEQLTPTVVST
uniref:Uncharacterized protein n=1 Tax=Ursus maritimus TaxID=29073 RepID=A0A452UTY5_URSMA